jgi:ferredoxin
MRTWILLFIAAALLAAHAAAEQRFPPPDFESGYQRPTLTFQFVHTQARRLLDLAFLAGALVLATWIGLFRRSRRGIFLLGLVCLAWFGFYKLGCICPIGAVQNVARSLFRPDFAIGLLVIGVFVLPLFLALFVGRVFCGAVCPLGAVQDVFLFRPVHVPDWLEAALGLLRWYILGAVVYVVVTWDWFPLCRYDPFVGFFRFSGLLPVLLAGGALLVLGMFVGRPYCRYLCPYGALLSLFSRWTGMKVTVTPDKCVVCTLCHDACPFGAIRKPADEYVAPFPLRLTAFISIPVLTGGLAALGWFVGARAAAPALLGAWFGLVTSLKLVTLTRSGPRTEYEIDQAACLSCARCYMACPREHLRLKKEAEARGASD